MSPGELGTKPDALNTMVTELQAYQPRTNNFIDIHEMDELDEKTVNKCLDQRMTVQHASDPDYLLCMSQTWEEDVNIFEKCFGVKFFPGRKRKRSPMCSAKAKRKRKKMKQKEGKCSNGVPSRYGRLSSRIGGSHIASKLAEEVLALDELLPSFKCEKCHKIFSSSNELGSHMKSHDVMGPPPKLINLTTLPVRPEDIEEHHKASELMNVSQSRTDVQLSDDLTESRLLNAAVNITTSSSGSQQDLSRLWVPDRSVSRTKNFSRLQTGHSHKTQHLIDLTTGNEDDADENRSTVEDNTVSESNISNTAGLDNHIQSNRTITSHNVQTHPHQPPSNAVTTTPSDLRCQSCGMGFDNQQELEVHSKSHRAGKSFHCNACDKTFMNKLTYLYHAIQHTNDQPIRCNLCSAEFQSEKELRKHRRGHKMGKQYSCDTCGEAFVHKLEYLYHAMKHQGLGPFKCSVCDQEFSRNEDLTKHTRTHRMRKTHKCEECGEMFCKKLDLLYHAVEHKEAE